MNKLKIGIIGGGAIVRSHLPQLVERADAVDVVALADVNPQAAAATAAEFSIPLFTSDYKEWIQDVDAVIIGVPTHLHHSIGIDAARAGKAIFMEKPLTRTREQAEALLSAVQQNGVPFQVGFVRRFDEEWLTWRRLVQEGKIGNPVCWHDTTAGWGPGSAWFLVDEIGGGPFLDGCIHNYDFALHTFGPAKWAFAHLRTLREGATAFDTGTATIHFESGDELMLAWSWGLPRRTSGTRRFEIFGPRGVLKLTDADNFQILTEGDTAPTVELVPKPAARLKRAFANQMDEFIKVASGAASPRAGAQEGLNALNLALAVLESGRSGEVVHLN